MQGSAQPDSGREPAGGIGRLLARLHPDADRAGDEYERLRRTLIRFFDWRGAWPPDECADIALDRLARKLEESTDIADINGYAFGIARLVLLERLRRPTFTPLDEVPEPAAKASSGEDEPLQRCFERCLGELPHDSRTLVLRYYEDRGRSKILNRRQLATGLGLTENALRSRIQRLRDRLEHCINGCVAATSGHTP